MRMLGRVEVILALALASCGGRTTSPTADAGRDSTTMDEGCEEGAYTTAFTCTSVGGAACPEGETCPMLPLGEGCAGVPSVLGHAPLEIDGGVPMGCRADLSFGNPWYSCSQQYCICQERIADGGLRWACPI